MKQTLLELTQSILASMDSDEVNSIEDTVESYDIAVLLRDVYYDIAVELNLTSHENIFELTASGDADQPTLMYLPDNVQKLYWIKYNNQLTTETYSNYVDVEFQDFNKFSLSQNALHTQTSDIGEMTITLNESEEDFEFIYCTDKMPQFYTHIGNDVIVFDSFDSTEDTTLVKSKTMCGGLLYPTFTLEDSFTPDLDASEFPYYRNKAKARAFTEKKQVDNREALQEARTQKILIQKRKDKINEGPALKRLQARYGRK